jgi:DNA-binding winged helix-turn-helix (wHTH) protein
MPRLRIEPQEQFPPARRDSLSMIDCRPSRISAAALEFGRFRVELRRRELLADGAPIELGTRAFELLLVLLEADGSLVTKQELQSRVWPGIVVAEENLKVQISALRRALGKDREFIRTEFGRGYRFTAAVRSTGCWSASPRSARLRHRSARRHFHRRAYRNWHAATQVGCDNAEERTRMLKTRTGENRERTLTSATISTCEPLLRTIKSDMFGTMAQFSDLQESSSVNHQEGSPR